MVEILAENAQILLLEMQREVVAASKTLSGDSLKRAAAVIGDIAQAIGIPITASVVSLNQRPPSLIEELSHIEPLCRTTIGAFDDSRVADRIAGSGRNILILGGVSSEIAILRAVIDARRVGYDVHVLVDLCGGLDSRTESAAFERMWAEGARASSVSSFATELISSMTAEAGQAVMQSLDRYHGWSGSARALEEAGAPTINVEVAKLFTRMQDSWKTGDAESFAAVFASRCRFVAFDGTVLTGPSEIATYHATPFATYLAKTKLRLKAFDVQRIADHLYLVGCEGGIVRGRAFQGELIGKSAQTFVIECQEAGCFVLAFQNTRVRPIDGPASATVWKNFDNEWASLGSTLVAPARNRCQ